MFLLSRTAKFAKLFFLVTCGGLFTYVALAVYTFHLTFNAMKASNSMQYKMKIASDSKISIETIEDVRETKYILLWTTPDFRFPFKGEGDKLFIDNDCSHLNCYLTTTKSKLRNVTKFDAIIFSISLLRKWDEYFPKRRSHKQKYIFYSTIPSNSYPICNIRADDYFNWTWTYKFQSDIFTPMIVVKDLTGNIIAPRLNAKWLDIDNSEVTTQPDKRKAVIWHNEICENDRAKSFAKTLKRHLKEHDMDLDMYGCDNQKCPNEGCGQLIQNAYFYLAFEDSFSDEYVSKEVLKGYNNNAVPIVVGKADYSNFLPPGSYIDARYESPDKLASLLGYIARYPIKYNKYFNWKRQYTIQEANLQKGYCTLCALLNDKNKVETHHSYESIRKWWYHGNLHSKCYPKGAETFDEVLSYIDNPIIRKNYMP